MTSTTPASLDDASANRDAAARAASLGPAEQLSVAAAPTLRRRLGPWGVPVILLILVAVFQSVNSQFLSVDNLRTILETAALPAVVACGLTVILAMNQFDLSVQAIAGLATTVFAVLMAKVNLTLGSAILVMLLIGLAIGLITGWLIAYRGLSALVVTVGLASILNGGEFAATDSQSISTGISPGFIDFVRSTYLGVPTLVYVAAIVALALWVLIDKTALGREFRAVGANPEAARFAGVNVRRTILTGFVVSGLVCTIAGMFYTGRQGIAYPLTGLAVLLPAFAACFIGAAMFRIGEFNIPGTVVGSVLAAVVSNGLLLANIGGYASYFFQGGILIAAVLFARIVAGEPE